MSRPLTAREGTEYLFRLHPQLPKENCHIRWNLRDRRLIFEAREAPGGVTVTFGGAFFTHPDAIRRALEAALRIRRGVTLAVADRQYTRTEEVRDA